MMDRTRSSNSRSQSECPARALCRRWETRGRQRAGCTNAWSWLEHLLHFFFCQ